MSGMCIVTCGLACPQQTTGGDVIIIYEVVELQGTITESESLTGTIVDGESLTGVITCEDSP